MDTSERNKAAKPPPSVRRSAALATCSLVALLGAALVWGLSTAFHRGSSTPTFVVEDFPASAAHAGAQCKPCWCCSSLPQVPGPEQGQARAAGTEEAKQDPAYVAPQWASCSLAVVGGRPGTAGYGAWPLCLNQVPPAPIVYSIGIGGDVSFDADFIRRGAQIFAFDPTIDADAPSRFFFGPNASMRSNFTFMQVGLGPTNGVLSFFRAKDKRIGSLTAVNPSKMKEYEESVQMLAPTLTLETLMTIRKHDHIDVLKVDIEGVEFELCKDPGFLGTLRKVGQLLFEFHDRLMQLPPSVKESCVQRLSAQGFTLVNSTIAGEHVFARMKAP